jgi:signal transduction histidine kinase
VSSSAQTIAGDSDRLRELVSNLLFNAISYNRTHGVVAADVRSERGCVVLKVQDTGIGVDAADLPHIFERFYRGERARERAPSGAGLGLALAQWIVGAHGGTIECTSEPGHFTEFVVSFPPFTEAPVPVPVSESRRSGHEREGAMSTRVPE